MDPERWRQIEELYHATLEHSPETRQAFLAGACRQDADLRREVESLLAQQTRSSGLVDAAAWQSAATPAVDATVTQAAIGAQLGPYRIEAPLGAGGMGQVFKARDTRLGRAVAIKVVNQQFSARFEREARAISSLNHPHICTLYDVGPSYLVMELVEGETLSARLEKGPLPLAEALRFAVQIAEALVEAHSLGIIHRDLKPGNIMITRSGIKVLDFGLAKFADSADAPTKQAESLTVGQAIVGTPAYMAPEQVSGEQVDARTDLFSFGAVLYETATRRRAFPRYLDRTPPPPIETNSELQRITRKALATDRALRYQTSGELLTDLQRLQRAVDAPAAPTPAPRRAWTIALAGAALAAVVVVAALVWWRSPAKPPDRSEWVQITNFPDSVSQPAFSRDGRMVTFIRGPDTFAAPGQIYVKMLPDGEAAQLTRDDYQKMSPAFSPDGSQIAYTALDGSKWNTWAVSVLSGQPRPWLPNASGLVWLDKQRMMFSEIRDNDIHMAIVTAEENRAGARDVYVPPGERGMAHRSYPSPDGKWALVVEMDRAVWLPCRVVPTDGRSLGRQVGPPGARCTFAAWSPDGKWMYLSSDAGGDFHIWRQRFAEGRPEEITSGPTEEEGMAIAPDGRSLITAVGQRQSVVSVHDSNGERQVSVEGYSYDPKFAADGTRLYYRILHGASPVSDPSELQVVDLASGRSDPLLPGFQVAGMHGAAYDISRDGRQVVVAAPDRDGKRRLWLASLDRQSPPRQIPNVEGDMPAFGEADEIFFRAVEGTSAFAYRIHEDGTGLRKAVEQPVAGIDGISQDGEWLVVKLPGTKEPSTTAFPLHGGPPLRICGGGIAQANLSWSRDGRLLSIWAPTSMSLSAGRTYLVPLPPGHMFPEIPPGGFASGAEIAKLAGSRVIDAFAAPGPTAEVYAYSRETVQRNLYRVPLQ